MGDEVLDEALDQIESDIVRRLVPFVLLVCRTYNASVTSWWRSPLHNAAVGGVPESKHRRGLACDVVYEPTSTVISGHHGVIVRWPSFGDLQALAKAHGCRVLRNVGEGHDHLEVI